MVRLELSLLGGFHAQVDGSPAVGLDTDKTRALLVYLSVESSRAHTRDALAGLLWPDLPDDAARRNLRNSLFKLRQVLGEEEGGIPVRLEVRVAPPADQIKLVLIAVDELRLGMGVDLKAARSLAYERLSRVSFEGMHFRRDIAGWPGDAVDAVEDAV